MAAEEEADKQAAEEEKKTGEENKDMADNYGEYDEDGFGEDEEFDFDSILGIDQLDLNYEAHVAGFDGESFLYSVYFDGGAGYTIPNHSTRKQVNDCAKVHPRIFNSEISNIAYPDLIWMISIEFTV